MSTHSLYMKTLISLLCLLAIPQFFCRDFRCNMTGDPDIDDSYTWYSTTDFVPHQGTSCGNMYLGHINTLEFDFVWGGRAVQSQAEMFFRVGFDSEFGTTCDGQQSQYPSFWMSRDGDYLELGVSDADSCNHKYTLSDYGEIDLDVNHHIFVYFDDDIVTINVSGGNKDDYYRSWTKTRPYLHHIGMVVPVWFMSSKFGQTQYIKANGTFSNIVITSSQFTNDTWDPTESPTSEPMDDIMDPTKSPTAIPTIEDMEMTFDFTGITVEGEMDLEEGPHDHNLETILIVVAVLLLCCGGLWYYNKSNKREEEEVVFVAAPEDEGKPKSRKKAKSHQRLRKGDDLDGCDDLEYEVGTHGQKVYKDIGAVDPKTLTYFKSPQFISSPVIEDGFKFNAIPEDVEDDEMHHGQHQKRRPSSDVDEYINQVEPHCEPDDDDPTQMMMQKEVKTRTQGAPGRMMRIVVDRHDH